MITVQHQLARLNATIAQAIPLAKKTPDEILVKKGRDLGIKFYQGFRDRQWGGQPRKKGRALATAELEVRTKAGRGTRVRSSLLAEYRARRNELRQAAKTLRSTRGPLSREAAKLNERERRRNMFARAALWQQFVGREIGIRGRGLGVLAVSFLWFRRRFVAGRRGRETVFRRNQTGRPLGYVERTDTTLRIVGLTPGLTMVDARYGVIARAIAAVSADTESYVARKYAAIFNRAA